MDPHHHKEIFRMVRKLRVLAVLPVMTFAALLLPAQAQAVTPVGPPPSTQFCAPPICSVCPPGLMCLS